MKASGQSAGVMATSNTAARSNRFLIALCQLVVFAICAAQVLAQQPVIARTPATPLVLHDPYFSVWSFDDKLTAGPTRHWTGTVQQLNGTIRIDGENFRFIGNGQEQALPQISRALWPTRTIYDFEGAGIHLTATFLTPARPEDLDIFSRPIT